MNPKKSKDYCKKLMIHASPEKVFDALTTLPGLRGWWTPLVKGAGSAGNDLRFEFNGLPEHILIHVNEARKPSTVRWTCKEHTKLPDWNGTQMTFELSESGEGTCQLSFVHKGLTPHLECYDHCELGWDHFLNSIAKYVENGQGEPYGDGWDVEQCENR